MIGGGITIVIGGGFMIAIVIGGGFAIAIARRIHDRDWQRNRDPRPFARGILNKFIYIVSDTQPGRDVTATIWPRSSRDAEAMLLCIPRLRTHTISSPRISKPYIYI